MTLIEFVPVLVASLIAALLAVYLFGEFGWFGLCLGVFLGALLLAVGIGTGILVATRWWPRGRRASKRKASKSS